MIGKLSSTQIEELLQGEMIGRIGCHYNGTTYIVPVSYAYDGTNVYVHTYEGMKIEFMRHNPAVCFQVDHMQDMGNWQSVVAWGQFEELSSEPERSQAIQVLQNRRFPIISSVTLHLGEAWPFSSDSDKDLDGIIFRIGLNEKTGRFESTSYSH